MELISNLTLDEIRKYNLDCLDPNREVQMDRHEWTDSALFTVDSSTCFVPVVVDKGLSLLGLGHYPASVANPRIPFMVDQTVPRADYYSYLEEAGYVMKDCGKLQMYLFGGTVGDEEYLEKGRQAVIECKNVVSPKPQYTLTLLIADIQRKTIWYQYMPHRKMNR
jgi:hypothetical protein